MYARVLAEYYPPRRRANPTIVLFKPQEDRPFLDMHGGGEQREDNPAASSSSAHAQGSTREVHNLPPVLPVGAGRPVTIVDTDNQVLALSSSVARVAAQPADFESTEAAADPHGSRVASAQAETDSYNVVYPPPRHPSGTVYHVLGQIGRGGFSRVMVAASSAGELVALKIMHKPTVLRLPNMRENVKMERDIMAMVIDRRKQFLLPLKAAWEQGDHIYFAMELCPQDLRSRIRSGFISRREKQLLCMEMILALIDLQKLEVIHGDIKPDNFLITKTGRVVLSDFGLAQRPTRLNRCRGMTGLYDFADWSASETYGTPGYVAPEGLCRRSAHYTGGLAFTSRADIFSLGLVFVELFCGLDKPIWLMPNLAPEHPDMDTQTWEEMDEFEQQAYLMMTEGLSRIHTGDLWMDNPAKRMVTQMLHVDALKRPTAYELLGHPYFFDLDVREVYTGSISHEYEPYFLTEMTSVFETEYCSDWSNFATYEDRPLSEFTWPQEHSPRGSSFLPGPPGVPIAGQRRRTPGPPGPV